MRKSNKYASGEESEAGRDGSNIKNRIANQKLKRVLKQCKEVISQLHLANQNLQRQLKQKQTIVMRLIDQKQEYLLHKAQCNTENLQKQIEIEHQKQNQMTNCFKHATEKYDKIIDKYQAEIQRLKSYNRALRVENNSFKDNKELKNGEKRKIGSITQSCKKVPRGHDNDEYVKRRDKNIEDKLHNIEDKLEQTFAVAIRTPDKVFDTVKSTFLPSTQHSLQPTFSVQLNSKPSHIPKYLFRNQLLRQLSDDQSLKKPPSFQINTNLLNVQRMMKRVNQLLAQSDGQQAL